MAERELWAGNTQRIYAQYLLAALGAIPFSWCCAFIMFLFIGRRTDRDLGSLLLFEKI